MILKEFWRGDYDPKSKLQITSPGRQSGGWTSHFIACYSVERFHKSDEKLNTYSYALAFPNRGVWVPANNADNLV